MNNKLLMMRPSPPKCSPSILTVLLIIVQLAIVLPVAAQKKPTAPGVAMTNVYDAFGKENKRLKQDSVFLRSSNTKGKRFCLTREPMPGFLRAI